MWAFAAKTWLAFLSSTRKERGFGGRSTTIENKMRKSLIVHIGFAKTSTKTLQKIIFPKVCETTGYKYFREDSWVEREVRLHLSRLYTGKDCRKLNIPKGTIVSAEELANSRPYKWEEFLIKNLEAFGSDAHILLTIRDPISWFTSLYLQKCVHQAMCMKPEDFFCPVIFGVGTDTKLPWSGARVRLVVESDGQALVFSSALRTPAR